METNVLDQSLADALHMAGLEAFAWDAALECPQQHPNRDENDEQQQPAGTLCTTCWWVGWRQPRWLSYQDRKMDPPKAWDQTMADEATERRADDPTYHPEWRIRKVPKPLSTDANVLLAAMEAWRKLAHGRMWTMFSADNSSPTISEVIHKGSTYTQSGVNPVDTLAKVFLAALKENADA